MNFPKVIQIVLAIVFAAIAYFIVSKTDQPEMYIALFVFVSSLAMTFIGNNDSEGSNDDIKTLYVGNLPYRANEGAVRALFSEHGRVHSVRLMKDKHTGKRRGFGFVEMAAADADNAVNKLNDAEFQQRTLKVREAKERPEKQDD